MKKRVRVSAIACRTAELKAIRHEPHPELISRLEALLVDARSGHLQSFAAVGATSDASIREVWYLQAGANQFTLLGAIRLLERSFIDEELELRKPPCLPAYAEY